MKMNLDIKSFALGALLGRTPAYKPGTRLMYRLCAFINGSFTVHWRLTVSG